MAMRGFTLLELLVVLAIMALIMTLALPRFTQALPGVELKRSAAGLAASLRAARDEAIRTNRAVTVRLGDDAADDQAIAGQRNPQLPEEVALQLQVSSGPGTRLPSGAIRFFPDGTSSSGLVTLVQGDSQLFLAVDWLTGSVRVQE